MINKNNNRFIKAMNDSAVMISKEAQMEAPGAQSSDPCVKKMRSATDIKALFDAFESCMGLQVSETKVETEIQSKKVKADFLLTFYINVLITTFKNIIGRLFGNVMGWDTSLPYSLFWRLLCNAKKNMHTFFTRLIRLIKDFPALGGEAIEQILQGCGRAFAEAFSWSNIPGLKQFFDYLVDPAISANDMEPSRQLLNSLCEQYAALVSLSQGSEVDLEQRAKGLYDMIIEFLGVLGGGLAVVNARALAILNAVMSWIGSHPGETLTIAAIIAIAAALVFGTGGLGAPAVPEVAAAIIAIAAALGITNDYSEDQIVEMLNQANNG